MTGSFYTSPFLLTICLIKLIKAWENHSVFTVACDISSISCWFCFFIRWRSLELRGISRWKGSLLQSKKLLCSLKKTVIMSSFTMRRIWKTFDWKISIVRVRLIRYWTKYLLIRESLIWFKAMMLFWKWVKRNRPNKLRKRKLWVSWRMHARARLSLGRVSLL